MDLYWVVDNDVRIGPCTKERALWWIEQYKEFYYKVPTVEKIHVDNR